ncbi:MAG: M15 family metallopeptidase [Ruminococcus sp.]|nr:M15 family metallopeptidase [Ruminococcus sp.]
MTKGDKRRGRKKYRVRYDRIVVLVLLIISIAVVVSSCVKKFSGEDDTETSSDVSSSAVTEPTESETPTEPQATAESTEAATDEADVPTSSVEYDKTASQMGSLVLVNSEYEYTFPEGDIDPVTIVGNRNDFYQAGDYVTKLDKDVIAQLNALMEAYAASMNAETTGIFIQDGYRTFEEQEERHRSGKSKTFDAGHTDYHTGRTFDVFRYDSQSGTGYSYFEADDWFKENSGNYGFILRYPEGKETATGENPRTYTYRYVGVPHASYINSHQLCLEEYITEVKGHTNENPLEISANGHTYNVYYVPAETEGKTAVPVPTDKEYTVSGCNAGGFIVTAALN